MKIDKLLQEMKFHASRDAMIWRNRVFTYAWMLENMEFWKKRVKEAGIKAGQVVELAGECSPFMACLLLSLILEKCITMPVSMETYKKIETFRRVAKPGYGIELLGEEEGRFVQYDQSEIHPLIQQLQEKSHPGLVLFSSGSTGESKGIVHDWNQLLEKYRNRHPGKRVLAFLLFDHIGGINTILHTLFNGGCLIVPENHSAEVVCSGIDAHRAEVLPASPTFLNLLLINKCHMRYRLDTLKQITYGTEPMPETLLKKLSEIFPSVRFLQTYGLSELGILHVKSRDSDSLLLQINQDNCRVRIIDGMLEIKTATSMLGYLNAASPLTEDGWFRTGDVVREEGEYLRILGRGSEIINVGGLKVYPVQVENVIRQMPDVEDVMVCGEASPVTGQIVKAVVKLSSQESPAEFRKRLHFFCKSRLEGFEIPQKVILEDQLDYGDRFKKMRKSI